MDNRFLADSLEELAALLELSGDARRARGLRPAARALRSHHASVRELRASGAIGELPGAQIALPLIDELLFTGTLRALERLRLQVPASVVDLLRVPGLRPSHVRALRERLGVQSLGELADACQRDGLLDLDGFDARLQAETLAAVRFLLGGAGLLPLFSALNAAELVQGALRRAGAKRVCLGGEASRGLEAVSAVVVVASGLDGEAARAALLRLPQLRAVGASGRTLTAEVALGSSSQGVPLRVRLSTDESWLADVLAETADAEHLRWLARRAREAGLDLAALTRESPNEEALYQRLGLACVPPELREGAAPLVPADLMGPSSLRGIFHVHTDWSDGVATIIEMARAARRQGYQYLGFSDHAGGDVYGGLDERRLDEQREAMRFARREVPGITLLHGCEVDILADGSLGIDDRALGELDFVIASVHSELHLPPEAMTRRLVRAVSHPLVTMLGHPTGRLLFARRASAYDLRAVVEAARANETYLEINGNAGRLDLNDALARRAAALGAEFVVSPDAHDEEALADAELGAVVARRAGLSASQVLNTTPLDELVARLAARRQRGLFALGVPRVA